MKEEINDYANLFSYKYKIKCDIFTFSILTKNSPDRPDTADIIEKLTELSLEALNITRNSEIVRSL